MKTRIKHFILLFVLTAGLGLMPADHATAQVLKTLLVFNPEAGYDPGNPYAGLIASGNTLFGTALGYSYTDYGAMFRLNTNGTGYVVYGLDYNTDGGGATDTPLLSSNTLYATSSYGGTANNGTVFLMSTNGYDTNVYSFSATSGPAGTNSDGAQPYGGLVLSGNMLYGTTRLGGTAGNGSLFAVNTDGLNFTNIHNFRRFPLLIIPVEPILTGPIRTTLWWCGAISCLEPPDMAAWRRMGQSSGLTWMARVL